MVGSWAGLEKLVWARWFDLSSWLLAMMVASEDGGIGLDTGKSSEHITRWVRGVCVGNRPRGNFQSKNEMFVFMVVNFAFPAFNFSSSRMRCVIPTPNASLNVIMPSSAFFFFAVQIPPKGYKASAMPQPCQHSRHEFSLPFPIQYF